MFEWILALFKKLCWVQDTATPYVSNDEVLEAFTRPEQSHLSFVSRYVVQKGEQVVLSDGTIATIERFGEKYVHRYGRKPNDPVPGVYEDRVSTWVRVESGKVIQVPSGVTFRMIDNEAFLKRKVDFESKDVKDVLKGARIGDLPDTPFWETDVVTFQNTYVVVETVNYDTTRNGKVSYRLKIPTGGVYPYVAEDYLQLVNRGNLWKLMHNELIDFKSVAEMADFYLQLGEYTEVKVENVRSIGLTTCFEMVESGKADLVISHGITYLSNSLVKLNNTLVAEKVRPYMVNELKKALEVSLVRHNK